jgi:hypothetical protein
MKLRPVKVQCSLREFCSRKQYLDLLCERHSGEIVRVRLNDGVLGIKRNSSNVQQETGKLISAQISPIGVTWTRALHNTEDLLSNVKRTRTSPLIDGGVLL